MMKRALGVFLLALPFIGIFAVAIATAGWSDALKAIGTSALILVCIFLGTELLQ